MADGGKGSRPRPYSISQEEFGNNFDAIFGKKTRATVVIDETPTELVKIRESVICPRCKINTTTQTCFMPKSQQATDCPMAKTKE